jgi:hypothetical protein
MNRKTRNKKRLVGTKAKIMTKKKTMLGKEQLKKQIIDNKSRLKQKKNKKNDDNLIS